MYVYIEIKSVWNVKQGHCDFSKQIGKTASDNLKYFYL